MVKWLFSLWFNFETVKLQHFSWNFKNFAFDLGLFSLSFVFGYLLVFKCHQRQQGNFINKQNKKKVGSAYEYYLLSSDEKCNIIWWRKPCFQGGSRRVSASPTCTGSVCGIIVVSLMCVVFSFLFSLFPTQFSSRP